MNGIRDNMEFHTALDINENTAMLFQTLILNSFKLKWICPQLNFLDGPRLLYLATSVYTFL